MESRLQNIYNSLPAFMQNAVLSGYSLLLDRERYGGEFTFYRNLLKNTERFSEADLIAYQETQLQKLIHHVYQTVPFYRAIFQKKKLVPADIKKCADLVKLPILTKKDIKNHFHELISRDFKPGKLKKGHTSGTTGSPLEVCYDASTVHITYAALGRQYQWAGASQHRFGDRIAVLRGNVIVPLTQKEPPFWRHNYLHNQLLLSSFHLSRNNMPAYFDKIKKFSPKILDGYPSTLFVLAKYLHNIGEKYPIHAIISSSETLYDFQREMIEESFQCRVFDYYALAERVVFATECEKHTGHHLCSEYGITEVLDQANQPVAVGNEGKMVGTSLHNFCMPLIRYVTDDMTAIKPVRCPCGRSLPLMEDVTTKAEDMLTLKDGRLISSSTLTHPFKPMYSVEESQIIQDDYDHIRIKLVPNEKFNDADFDHLINEFQARLGQDVNIEVEIVNSIPRTKSGKFRWVISHVELGI
jgi:phenylacetate-CoA ligase